jgi:hypothetical protein
MKKTTLLLRCGYVIIVAILVYWITSGVGSRTKDYSSIESSITRILAGQSIDSAKRSYVVDFLNRRLSDEQIGTDKVDKESIFRKIYAGKELNFSERQQLSEWINRYTSLTVKMPGTNVFRR